MNHSYCRECRNAYVRERREASYATKERELARLRYIRNPDVQIDRVTARRKTPAAKSKARELVNRKIAENPVRHFARQMLASARCRADGIGVEFDLTEEWIAERLRHGTCAVTGIPFDLSASNEDRRGQKPHRPSLDRKVSGGNYTMDNVQVVVTIYNVAKSNWGHRAVQDMAAALTHVSHETVY